MKKLISILIVSCLAATMLAACGAKQPVPADNLPESTSSAISAEETSEQSIIELPANAAVEGDKAPAVTDLAAAGLPSEAVLLPESEWNDMGDFNARLIAYVQTTVDPSVLSEDFPKDNKFFGLFWQVESVEPPEYSISGSDFGVGGPGVAVVSAALEQNGDINSSCIIPEPWQPGYVYTLITAEKLEDITQAWYRELVEDKATGELGYAYHYITSLPIGSLIVNQRPEGFDYCIPPSATAMVGEWSNTSTGEETVKMRTLAVDIYPMNDATRPEFMTPDQELYVLYLEVRNEGEQDIEFSSALPGVEGKDINDSVSFWGGYDCTDYGTGYKHPMPKGATDVIYTMFVAKDLSDVTGLLVSKREDPATPIPFNKAAAEQPSSRSDLATPAASDSAPAQPSAGAADSPLRYQ